MVGPTQAGKTRLANQLGGVKVKEEYDPTLGVRILEFDVDIQHNSEDLEVKIELWDLSGDNRFETCYHSVCDKLDGLVVVYNSATTQSSDVSIW